MAQATFVGNAFCPSEFLRQVRQKNTHLACVSVLGPVGDTIELVFARFFDPLLGGPDDAADDEEYLCWSPEGDPTRASGPIEGVPQLLAMVRKYLDTADILVECDESEDEDGDIVVTLEGTDRESADYSDAGVLEISRTPAPVREAIRARVASHNADMLEVYPWLAKGDMCES